MAEIKRGRQKDPGKAQAILEAAACLFLQNGLKGTSMETIAKQAQVSKPTLYSHFKDKDDLYRGVIKWKMSAYDFSDDPAPLSDKLQDDLYNFGRRFLGLILDEQAVQMVCMLTSERECFAQTAKMFYEVGPQRVIGRLEALLAHHNVVEPDRWAVLLVSMFEREWHLKSTLGLLTSPTQAEIDEHVKDVVEKFLSIQNVHS